MKGHGKLEFVKSPRNLDFLKGRSSKSQLSEGSASSSSSR